MSALAIYAAGALVTGFLAAFHDAATGHVDQEEPPRAVACALLWPLVWCLLALALALAPLSLAVEGARWLARRVR